MRSLYTMVVAAALAVCSCGDDPVAPSAVCGNGVVEGTREGCDDGNDVYGDGCSYCLVESGFVCTDGVICAPVCNDGILASAEVCDPSLPAWTEYCSSDCTMRIASCGDNVVQAAHEMCDDGNMSSADTCTKYCQPSFLCDASGVCSSSPVDGASQINTLGSGDASALCRWYLNLIGGEYATVRCPGGSHTLADVSYCSYTIRMSLSGCSVAQFTDWIAERRDACDVIESTPPAC